MVYGPLTARRGLPVQNWDTILLLADRFDRASQAQAKWAETAKKCIEFVAGQQWSQEDLDVMESQDRPALTFNKIGPLVRLVIGYYLNNRTDVKYLPGHDAAATQEVADYLTKVGMGIAADTAEKEIDAEVFTDGITTGRGFYDYSTDEPVPTR